MLYGLGDQHDGAGCGKPTFEGSRVEQHLDQLGPYLRTATSQGGRLTSGILLLDGIRDNSGRRSQRTALFPRPAGVPDAGSTRFQRSGFSQPDSQDVRLALRRRATGVGRRLRRSGLVARPSRSMPTTLFLSTRVTRAEGKGRFSYDPQASNAGHSRRRFRHGSCPGRNHLAIGFSDYYLKHPATPTASLWRRYRAAAQVVTAWMINSLPRGRTGGSLCRLQLDALGNPGQPCGVGLAITF